MRRKEKIKRHIGDTCFSSFNSFYILWFLDFHFNCTFSSILCFTDKPNKKNFVDDNDISIYKTKRAITTSLFTPASRPEHVKKLYDKAAATPVVVVTNGDTNSEVNFVLCSSSSFGHTRRHIKRKIDAEIETRVVSEFHFFLSTSSSLLCILFRVKLRPFQLKLEFLFMKSRLFHNCSRHRLKNYENGHQQKQLAK